MAYKKVGWKDYPSTDTPINATNLDHMDAGILENAQTIGDKTKISDIGDGTIAGAIAANKSAIDANAEAIAQNTQSLTNLIKNNPGDPININTYTETNKFTIPTDGYITIQFSSNSALHAANVMIYGSNGNGITSFGTVTNSNVPGNQQNVAVFVKKGMKCAVLNRSSAATVYYKPLA